MTEASRPKLVIAGLALLAAGLFCRFEAAAQVQSPATSSSRKATASQTAHKRTAFGKTPAPRAINAEELQSLLKRDGTRPLLVNYWATWCDPCRDEFPDLVKIDQQYRPKGLDFIAISLDDLSDLKTAVPEFLHLMKAKMPVYLLSVSDPEPAINAVDPAWGGSLPATFLYNNNGEVVYKHFGRVKTDELRAAINKVMSAK